MHIGLDARFYGPASTGLGRYTAELVRHLLPLGPSLRLTLFVLNREFDLAGHPQVRTVVFPYRWYSAQEQLRFPSVIRRAGVDVMHFPHFNVPLAAPRPFVVTIHDLILHDFPTERATTLGPVQYWLKRRAYHWVIRRAVDRAERVLTITEHSAESLRRHFSISPGKITVTYEGSPSIVAVNDAAEIAAIKHRFGLPERFLFYVGNAYPHKNLEVLLEALKRLQRVDPELALVIGGKHDYFNRQLQQAVVHQGLRLGRDVLFPGFLTDRELAACYRLASLYVFPSLAEGFGLPPLEAMSFDLPVAASRASCLPEVLGDAALYFQPHDPAEIAHVIRQALTDTVLRRQLVEQGRKQITKYSWQRLASETLAVYRSVVEAKHATA